MAAKTIAVLCASAIILQTVAAQCANSFAPRPFVGPIPNIGCGSINYNSPIAAGLTSAKTNAGSFTVTSSSPIAPSGVSVVSEYVIEGPLAVTGELPLLGAIGMDGELPTGGEAGTSYACGSNVGITSESLANAGVNAYGSSGLSANLAGVNLGSGLAARLGHGYSCV
ncbi:chorion class CB protein PC404-like [Hyposmocoma kahamanoa]|uniref:chorion class CB protein PC404-like n=1 Tax=Hyposmocoma kahamanoa TaxID=1477025 RepID=UPI000E6D9949|nr:chorion class CB protein PC404-like [Hyposmocoma kahamanoa]